MAVPVDAASLTLAERFEALSADAFWVPPRVRVVERPEIVYTAADDPEIFFNAVSWVRATSSDVARRLVAEVDTAHAGHASRWSLAGHATSPALEAALAEAGYARDAEHDLRVLATEGADAALGPEPAGLHVRRVTDATTLLDLHRVTALAFARPVPEPDAQRIALELAQAAPADARVARFVVYRGAEAVAGAGLTLDRRLGVGFLWAGGTVAHARGHGAYRALVRARAQWAAAAGIGHVGVFARRDTSSPILARCGLDALGTITFWERPAPPHDRSAAP